MLEWKPRLVLLVFALAALAAMLAWGHGIGLRNYGW